MEIIQFTYGATINLGNYENEKIDIVAVTEPGSDENAVIETIRRLRAIVASGALSESLTERIDLQTYHQLSDDA